MAKQPYLDFDEYIRQGEPSQREKAAIWSTAIGLQAVDGLQVSSFLLGLVRKNIEGEITIDQVQELLDDHYKKKKHKKEQPRLDTPTSCPTSTPTSTVQVGNQFWTNNENIQRLVKAIAYEKLSLKEMMGIISLKDRKNFLDYSLNPAITEGFVCMLFPESPRHPRQKYLLTVKGAGLYNLMMRKEGEV